MKPLTGFRAWLHFEDSSRNESPLLEKPSTSLVLTLWQNGLQCTYSTDVGDLHKITYMPMNGANTSPSSAGNSKCTSLSRVRCQNPMEVSLPPSFQEGAEGGIGKVYVQDLIWDARAELAPLILEKRAYIYICGDAKSMSKSVEEKLIQMLADAVGGMPEVEGAKELKLLKERNVRPA